MQKKIEKLFSKYQIKGISCDSRNLAPNDAFFAIKGTKVDGNQFINEALNTAKIAFTDDLKYKKKKVFYITSTRLGVAIAAGIIFPNLPKNLIAVTGTNGKTSVVSYIYQILELLGYEVASIGTIGIQSTIKLDESFLNSIPHSLTTIDPISFRKILNRLSQIGINNIIVEVSSHGIDQNRIGLLEAEVLGFTSFSQDHLDYHKSMNNYLQTKLQLFKKNLKEGGEVVISSEILDSVVYGKFIENFLLQHKIPYFSVGTKGTLEVQNITTSFSGTKIKFKFNNESYYISTTIVGSFQAVNLLIAAKVVNNLKIKFVQVLEVLGKVKSVVGRLQQVELGERKFKIFVDYAHTPDALEKSLIELQNIKKRRGKLYLIFGCGGERDFSKRGIMGQIACRLADYVIITDDNPRSENPRDIRFEILKELSLTKVEEIEGRELAIKTTIAKLKKDDILLIAGKGHENYQVIKDKTIFFSDIETVKKALAMNN